MSVDVCRCVSVRMTQKKNFFSILARAFHVFTLPRARARARESQGRKEADTDRSAMSELIRYKFCFGTKVQVECLRPMVSITAQAKRKTSITAITSEANKKKSEEECEIRRKQANKKHDRPGGISWVLCILTLVGE